MKEGKKGKKRHIVSSLSTEEIVELSYEHRCKVLTEEYVLHLPSAGPRSAIGRAPDSEVRGPGFDTRSGNILSFLLPLFQEGQLSVTGESMCTKYWLTA